MRGETRPQAEAHAPLYVMNRYASLKTPPLGGGLASLYVMNRYASLKTPPGADRSLARVMAVGSEL